jgi:hypothetical protein
MDLSSDSLFLAGSVWVGEGEMQVGFGSDWIGKRQLELASVVDIERKASKPLPLNFKRLIKSGAVDV